MFICRIYQENKIKDNLKRFASLLVLPQSSGKFISQKKGVDICHNFVPAVHKW
jgi:hypothetical protein